MKRKPKDSQLSLATSIPVALSEQDLRAAFFENYHEVYPWIFPNTRWDSWECDVLTIDKSGFSAEWEIKCSRADFRNDASKTRTLIEADGISLQNKYVAWQKGCGPNRFSYVVPEGLLQPDDLPSFAGLYYFAPDSGFKEVVSPPLLHMNPFSATMLIGAIRSVYQRFWQYKIRSEGTDTHLEKLRSERDKLKRRLEAELRFKDQNRQLTDAGLRLSLNGILNDQGLSEREQLDKIAALLLDADW